MNVLDAIKTRRSVKHYDAEHSLTEQELRTLLSVVALAPTSFNMQNRHVVAVVDQAVKNRVRLPPGARSRCETHRSSSY